MSISRRTFIKGGVATTLLAAASGGMMSYKSWLHPVEALAEGTTERVAHTFHQAHCGGHCSLKCTVRDGRIALIEPNDWPNPYMSTVCLKGISEIQHIYSIERIQTPLRRVGERGEGKFVPITWQEAFNTIEQELKKIQEKNGKDSVLIGQAPEANYPFLQQILGAQKDGKRGIDIGIGNGFDPALGGVGYGFGQSEIRDWVNASVILNVGSNPLETSLIDARHIFDAKEAGTKIITIDPHFSTTASKSDQWIPIKPGTDCELFLGMISLVLENNWYDKEYVIANTSLPFLMDVETGKLLRERGEAPSEKKDSKDPLNPFMVLDSENGSVKAYNTKGVTPALEGEFEIGGRKVQTVFSALKAQQKKYSLSWASERTGIAQDDFVKMTKLYATTKPALINIGWGGADKWSNADITGHAVVILASLTGNIGVKGGGAGCYIGNYVSHSAALGAWKLPAKFTTAPSPIPVYDMRYQNNNVKAMIAIGDTIHMHYGNMNTQLKWVESLEFIVGIDMYFTPSMNYADIVLPVCTKFECDEEVGGLKVARNHVMLREKVIDPLFESWTDFQIEREFARRWGVGEFYPGTAEQYVAYQLEKSTDPKLSGITLAALKKNNGIMQLVGCEQPYRAYTNKVFKTESGKLQLYYENLSSFGQALPTFEGQNEAFDENKLVEKYPLQFSQPRTKYHIHSQFCDASWIQQYYEAVLEINPVDAKSRNLHQGDVVEVFNDRGKFKCHCQLNEAVRPGAIRMYEGMWEKYMKEGSIQNVTNDARNRRGYNLVNGPVVPFNDTLVQVRKA
ncbi:MAG: molybdopterin-dependent oxidoreductase [Proteocatella sp.]